MGRPRDTVTLPDRVDRDDGVGLYGIYGLHGLHGLYGLYGLYGLQFSWPAVSQYYTPQTKNFRDLNR